MTETTNLNLEIYEESDTASGQKTTRQWFESVNDNFEKIDAAFGNLTPEQYTSVQALPEASETEYNKHLIYNYQNALYFIVLSNNVYSYVQVGKTYTAGNGIAIAADGTISLDIASGDSEAF